MDRTIQEQKDLLFRFFEDFETYDDMYDYLEELLDARDKIYELESETEKHPFISEDQIVVNKHEFFDFIENHANCKKCYDKRHCSFKKEDCIKHFTDRITRRREHVRHNGDDE